VSELLLEASAAMRGLHSLTVSFGTGSTPDPQSVLAYQSKIVSIHERLGQEMARKFGAKERAYLNRKIQEAKQYQHGRIELKKTASDSSKDAILAVGDELDKEIESAQEYESYRLMLQSLERAFQHSIQVVSLLKTSESSSSKSND